MCLVSLFLAAATINTAAELARATERYEPEGRAFDIVGRVTQAPYCHNGLFYLKDSSGSIELHMFPGDWRAVRPGDVFRIKGRVRRLPRRIGIVHADCETAEFLRHESPIEAPTVSAHDFLSGRLLFEHVSLDGVMSSVFRDEIDPNYIYFIMTCGDERVFAVLVTDADVNDVSSRLLGSDVHVTGCCSRDADSRSHCDYFLSLNGLDCIEVRERRSDDPFAAQDISDTAAMTPQAVSTLGRRLATGTVLATWAGNKALIRTAKNGILTATMAENALPAPGMAVEVSGYPETDLYSINLSRAVWRRSRTTPGPEPDVLPSSPSSLTSDNEGRSRIDASMHGRRISMTGVAKRVRRGRNDEFAFSIEDGNASVDVIMSESGATADIVDGCRVSVCGICVMEKEPWRPNVIIPRITDVFIVVNDRAGVRVVSRPAWWTPIRLLCVIVALAAALLAIFAWNMTLRTLVVRRSRQLFRAELSKADAQLRIDERTRLAAELHDSIAQTLSGVSLQIDAAERLVDGDREKLARSLHLASVALKSCRAELRDCLWDLRSCVLDAPDIGGAIRQTLAPIAGDANVLVRFNVRRSLVSDNTVHAIMRIVRELVSNAIRHGKAKTIRIAGVLEGRRIEFSVQDDGCGFRPGNVPSMRQGHFGLAGIRERTRKLNGSINIETAPGRGTKATVSLEGANTEKP